MSQFPSHKESPSSWRHAREDKIPPVLRPQFHYLIADVPRTPSQAYRRVLELADLRVIVADRTLHSARDAARLRRLLGDGDSEHRNLLVLNRSGEGGREAITTDEISKVVELEPKILIPYKPKLFTRAIIDNRPPAARAGSFADSIAALAHELSGRAPRRARFWEFNR